MLIVFPLNLLRCPFDVAALPWCFIWNVAGMYSELNIVESTSKHLYEVVRGDRSVGVTLLHGQKDLVT